MLQVLAEVRHCAGLAALIRCELPCGFGQSSVQLVVVPKLANRRRHAVGVVRRAL